MAPALEKPLSPTAHTQTVPFQQAPPELGNQFTDDRVLRGYLRCALPGPVLDENEDTLHEMGRLAGGPLYEMQLDDYTAEPQLKQWDAWGNRVDEITVTKVWQKAETLAAEYGLVALPYEQPHGTLSRIVQFALAYLFIPSTDVYGCPLAMTDGAARTLLAADNQELIDRAVPHLTSRDPEQFWTSGQWMTELPGGSDVGRTETVAIQDPGGTWRLHGRKWFTSAITANMALALARPEGGSDGGSDGGSGLALFFVPIRSEDGTICSGITVNRLKDKLGTKKLPTAELQLDGAEAIPAGDLTHGTRTIAPMLNVTRTWNAVTAIAYMRRGLALARDYAAKREAFGAPLSQKPLHVDTLAGLQATFEGAFHLTFRAVELLGQSEADELDEQGAHLLRLLTPLTKLTTAKQGVAFASEIVESFGGAGYVEDTGIPMLLRDAQVLSIWEGTTNVLALDVLRALEKAGGLDPLLAEMQRCADGVQHDDLIGLLQTAEQALTQAGQWLGRAQKDGRAAVEAGARRFALTVGHAFELALLAHHAQWALDEADDARPLAAARRLAADGINHLAPIDAGEAAALANDTPLPAGEPATA